MELDRSNTERNTLTIVSSQQPELLPWLNFFDKVDFSDRFILLDNVQFERRYFQNRFKIRDGAGGFQLVTLPVQKAVRETAINDIKIAQDDPRMPKILNLVSDRYKKAPFFNQYFSRLSDIFRSFDNLARLNICLIEFISDEFGLNKSFERASEVVTSMTETGSRRILQLCKVTGANQYLSGRMGSDYLNEQEFFEQGIEIIYQDYVCVEYPQPLEKKFVSHLSAVDLLFNVGPEGLRYIRAGRIESGRG